MNFDLSPEQSALADAAKELLARHCPMSRVRSIVGQPEKIDRALWDQVAAQGWLGVAIPEPFGGIGLGLVELSVLAEQAGQHLVTAPVVPTALALRVVWESGDRTALDRVRGSVCCVGRQGFPVLDAPVSDVAVLVDDDSVSLADLRQRESTTQPALDPTRSLAVVSATADTIRLGERALATSALDWCVTAVSASIVGACTAALTMSTEYAKVREQFGRPIGSFQAIKHRLADMYVDLEGMRAATYYAAWAIDNGTADASIAASAAKAWCSEAGPRLMASALQVHGGIGFTWEHDLHLLLKRTEVDARQFGDAAFHHGRVVDLLALQAV